MSSRNPDVTSTESNSALRDAASRRGARFGRSVALVLASLPWSVGVASGVASGSMATADAVQSVPPVPPQPSRPPTAQRAIDGASLGGFVLPVKPLGASCALSATRAWRWKVDDTQRLLLEGDVRVTLAGYSFSATRATVWINRLPVGSTETTQLAIWFESAREPTRRAGLGASGGNLLVTSTYLGKTDLSVVIPEDSAPSDRAFLAAGEARLADYLKKLEKGLSDGTAELLGLPDRAAETRAPESAPLPGASIAAVAAPEPALPGTIAVPAPEVGSAPIFRPDGTISFSADSITVDERADRIAVQGMVELEYVGAAGGVERSLQLSAERGVIFLVPGSLAALREGARSLRADLIAGIYLEGAVHASDGDYAVRGAQIYYDLAGNRAAIVDAVLRTYDRSYRDLPIYARAAELRQVAADQWTADRATVSTSEFFTPHLSIGVDRVTVTRMPEELGVPGSGRTYVSAEGAALEIAGGRILPLPGYEGVAGRIPLRGVRAGYERSYGVEIGTSWDLLALAGAEPTPGLDAELEVDAYTERGPGLGTTFTFGEELGSGIAELYGIYDFGGTDVTSAGEEVEVDARARGIVDAAWQTALSSDFVLKTQFAYLSDETFASAWREDLFDNRREFESSVFLDGVSENSALSLLLKYDVNEFISNSYLLASRSYVVDKLPELSYRRYGDEPFEGFTWSQQWSANAMQLRPTSGTPNSLGIPTGAWGGAIGANASIADAFEDAGYRDGVVSRLDTRHELSLPLHADAATLTPFVTGQATGYLMDEFSAYSADADNLRFQAGGGARASLRFVRVDDGVQSRLLDLNRLRHVIEPYSTLWAGWDSNAEGELPIYDQDYEGTTGGAAANVGIRNVLQTQRGGAGAWQSVDWLKLDVGVVLNDAGSDFTPQPIDPGDPTASLRWAQSPIPQFFSFRPEYSQWGSHFYGASTWQLSDTLSLGGTMTYLFEDVPFVTDDGSPLPNLAKGSLGVEMRHSPVASTYLEYRYLAPTASELLQAGLLYRAGKRYLIALSPQYDLNAGDFRAVSGSLVRTFPDFDLSASAGYDLIEDRTTVGLSLSIPAGSKSQGFGWYNPAQGGYDPR